MKFSRNTFINWVDGRHISQKAVPVMSDTRLMLVPCPYEDFPCSNYLCDQPSREKYWVGNPYSNNLELYPIFCKTCVDHLVSHLPPDLSPDGAAVEAHIRAELEQTYNAEMQEKLAQADTRITQEVTERLIAQFTKPELTEIPEVVATEQPEDDNNMVFRCLDCGDEFGSAEKLEAHKSEHAGATEPRKRGGRKKE